jgi:hypothetical protein
MSAMYQPRGFRGFLWRMRRWMNGQPMRPSSGLVVLPPPPPLDRVLWSVRWPALLAPLDARDASDGRAPRARREMSDIDVIGQQIPSDAWPGLYEWAEYYRIQSETHQWNLPKALTMLALIARHLGASDPDAARVAERLLAHVPPHEIDRVANAIRWTETTRDGSVDEARDQ